MKSARPRVWATGTLSSKHLQSSGSKNMQSRTSVPVPLHEKRQKRRGYNQSEQIARGIATVTGIPVETRWIARRKETETQTRKSVFERWENVEGGFELRIPTECLRGKHALVVDDVLTTGATTAACASTLTEAEGIQISILTLAVAE